MKFPNRLLRRSVAPVRFSSATSSGGTVRSFSWRSEVGGDHLAPFVQERSRGLPSPPSEAEIDSTVRAREPCPSPRRRRTFRSDRRMTRGRRTSLASRFTLVGPAAKSVVLPSGPPGRPGRSRCRLRPPSQDSLLASPASLLTSTVPCRRSPGRSSTVIHDDEMLLGSSSSISRMAAASARSDPRNLGSPSG